MRVPLIISAPWIKAQPRRSDAIVELVDVLPTIAQLAGLALPAGQVFDGASLVPLLQGEAWHKTAAFSQYPRRVRPSQPEWKDNSIIHKDRSTFTHMGCSVRVADWRLTEWALWNQTALRPLWTFANGSSGVVARELYDHSATRDFPTDFNQGENANVADKPKFAQLLAQLSARLRSHFPG